MINQLGPSFSMNASVEAPQGVRGYRLGAIQQVTSSLRRAHYNNLSSGAPWKIQEFSAGSGLDLTPRSTAPWYNSNGVNSLDPRAISGMVDDPGGDFRLVVNNRGEMRPPFEGKLARLSGCDTFNSWIAIESPDGRRQAFVWTAWQTNWNVTYNTHFNPSSPSPPTTSATASGPTGRITSAPGSVRGHQFLRMWHLVLCEGG